MWKNTVEPGRLEMTIWRMRIACWLPKVTNTHTQIILILVALPPQQWLHVSASVLCYKYSTCLVYYLSLNNKRISSQKCNNNISAVLAIYVIEKQVQAPILHSMGQPQTYVKPVAEITVFELLMISGVSLETY